MRSAEDKAIPVWLQPEEVTEQEDEREYKVGWKPGPDNESEEDEEDDDVLSDDPFAGSDDGNGKKRTWILWGILLLAFFAIRNCM